MHQLPRPAPRTASSANSPQTNPTRTNNQRDDQPGRIQSSVSSDSERSTTGAIVENAKADDQGTGQSPETARLNLIVQHFFTKAALIIASSRISLPPAHNKDGEARIDKWFNTWIEDTNFLSDDLQQWKTMDAAQRRPPPLVMEVYLDTAQLTQNQSLVAVGEDGRRYDVNEALRKRASLDQTSRSNGPLEIVYERWVVSLDDPSGIPASQLSDAPPNVYKKGVVLLRSLFTYTKFLPAWKLARRIGRQSNSGAIPRPKLRILSGDSLDPRPDTVSQPLVPGTGSVTENYHFAQLPCQFGCLKISVTYRSNCNFEIDTAERLLSARFGGSPMGFGTENSARAADSTSEELQHSSGHQPWSRTHNTSDSRGEDLPNKMPPDHRTAMGSKSSLRSDGLPASLPRRPSVSFQPFKAGSLSSSPASGLHNLASPSGSIGRAANTGIPSHSRSRSSLNTLPQQALRTPGMNNETAVASSASSSPKPAPIQRYSSSFGNRKARFPSNAGSKTEDDNNSSGRGSASSARGSSGTLNEGEASTFVGPQDDSESIGDFLKMLDRSSKGITSFNKTDTASLNANSQRTAAQYSRFTRMRDSTAHLSESMSSSLMLQKSSTSPSRQLSNVPGLVGSASASSSPGKPISPHTPHMPSVPSRLSNNSIIDYSRDQSRSRVRSEGQSADTADTGRDTAARERGAGAIDIPTSPRTFPSSSRRSSSVHHQARLPPHVDEEVLPFELRSASLPNDERPPYAVDDDEPLLFAMGELGSQRRLD